jgi:hypothetical protein
MVNMFGKCEEDTIQNGRHRSKKIPSPGMVNLPFLLLRFLSNDRLPIIMPLLESLSQLYEIDGADCSSNGEYPW